MDGNRISIGWKLALWFLLLSVVPISVIAIFVRQDVRETVADLTNEETRGRTALLAHRISTAADADAVSALLADATSDGRTAYIVAADGAYVAYPGGPEVGGSLREFPADVAQGVLGESGGVLTGETGRTFGFASLDGPSGAKAVLVVDAEAIAGPVADIERSAFFQLALSLAVVAIAGGAVIWVFFRPIRQLTRAAERIGAGELDVRVDPSDMEGELEVLAGVFNRMADQVRENVEGLEQRVAERTGELRESEARYRTLFEESIEAIFMTAADGKVVDINQAAVDLFGSTRDELIGRDYANRLVDAGDRDRMRAAMAAGEGTVKDFELQLRKRDGTVMDCVLTVRRRGASEGTPAGLEGTVRDITASKRTEEELFAQTRETAVLDERNRMAREIHDTLAQGFIGIVLQLEAGEQALGGEQQAVSVHIERAKSLARESLQEARRSVWDLVPGVLEARSLEDALKEEVRRFAARGLEKAAFARTGQARELPRDVQSALLRICQEALMNTRKHARASRVDVRLDVGPEAVSLVVEDDGVGFDPDTAASGDGPQSGYGMTSMVQRARLHGGTLTIESAGHKGTTVEAKIPTAGPHQRA